MQRTAILFLCLLSIAAAAQRRERQTVRLHAAKTSAADISYRPMKRGTAATNDASTVLQAPGVTQINLSDRQRSAWFVVTDTIPAGTPIAFYLSSASNDPAGYIKLGPISYSQDLAPGTSLVLPNIAEFGDFWPDGVTTYSVVVSQNGRTTQSASDFVVGAVARNYNDIFSNPVITPLIYSWSEGIVNRQVILTISGNFTSDPVEVVLEDLVVPAGAITLSGDGSTITVNLSQVPGSRLDILQDFLLTVGQAGFSDTRTFTHVPFNPANYDPSPNVQ